MPYNQLYQEIAGNTSPLALRQSCLYAERAPLSPPQKGPRSATRAPPRQKRTQRHPSLHGSNECSPHKPGPPSTCLLLSRGVWYRSVCVGISPEPALGVPVISYPIMNRLLLYLFVRTSSSLGKPNNSLLNHSTDSSPFAILTQTESSL